MSGRSKSWFGTASALLLAMTLTPTDARADIDLGLHENDPNRTRSGTSRGSLFDVDLTTRSAPALVPAGGVNPPDSGTDRYFTLFDYFGHISGSGDRSNLEGVIAQSWPVIEGLDTPSTGFPGDDPGVNPVIFGYGGPSSMSVGLNPLFLGRVSLSSTNPLAGSSISSYSGATQRASNQSLIANSTRPHLGPRLNAAVPEPGGLTLFALGLLGLAGYLWRMRLVRTA